MTKTVFTGSQNILVSGGPFKTESKKEKFPPKIILQNTKKGFYKLYALVRDLSNIQVISYGEFIDYLARKGDPRDIEIDMDGVFVFVPKGTADGPGGLNSTENARFETQLPFSAQAASYNYK